MSKRIVAILWAGAFVLSEAGTVVAQPVRVSVASDGTEANGSSTAPAMSATGRFVAFVSSASNLVAGDTNGVDDVFLRDRDTDADGVFDEAGAVSTVRVSERGSIQANGPSGGSVLTPDGRSVASSTPVITPDGRYVVFTSVASSLFSFNQPPLTFTQVFRWDRLSGDIALVSQNAAGEPLNGASIEPAVTADGNSVYFVTRANNVDGGPVGSWGLVLRRDIAQGTLTRVSEPLPVGSEVFGHEVARSPTVSNDGHVFAFALERILLGETGGAVHLVRVGQDERTFRGLQPKLSADGAFLAAISSEVFRVHVPTGERISVATVAGAPAARLSPSGRYLSFGLLADFRYGSVIVPHAPGTLAFDAGDLFVAYAAPNVVPGRTLLDVVTEPLAAQLDNDSDGLNDHWETAFGLSIAAPNGATGDDGAGGDPDHDGLTNAQELAGGSHPRGTLARFLAEGASGSFFTTRFAIVNPGNAPATAAVRFDAGAGEGTTRVLAVPARTRVTLDSHAEGLDSLSFATRVESDQPLVVDRLMIWGSDGVPYGSHAEASTGAPGTTWFLAEGSTVLGFQLFYLLQNPQATPTTATIRFLLPAGAPLVKVYELPAQSRTTVFVNTIPGLESTDVSADISATQPIAVERAMYRSSASQTFALGHDAAAVAAPATTWLFAEGSSNSFFDTYLLIANPSSTAATVEVTYLQENGGPLQRTYTVPARSRFSVFVDDVPGLDSNSYGMRVVADVPVVAERAMYWAGGYFEYYEGHVSAGATTPGGRWVLAESELTATPGARFNAVPFVLIANTGNAPVSYRVRTIPEAGGAAKDSGVGTLPAGARVTIPMSILLASGRFGVEVVEEGTSTGALIVEGAMYWSLGDQMFAAGANWPATRIP